MKKSRPLGTLCIAFVLAAILTGVGAIADAAPLRLDYQVSDLGGGSFQYDFQLVLDNNDGSWSPGNEFEWIIFGDRPGAGQPPQFGSDWVFTSVEAGWFGIESIGSHEGPTVCFGSGCTLPGWVPSALGESVNWSGTSSSLIADPLAWSYMVAGGGASAAEYFKANETIGSPVPIPAAVWLFSSGLLGLVGLTRRKKTA
jgi:hypothetical protein